MSHTGWIGVDFDGTLAEYNGWQGLYHLGEPVPAMVARVQAWLAEGKDVRVFTARICENDERTHVEALRVKDLIQQWCKRHLGQALPVTNVKDFAMIELWDDRCIRVVANEGVIDGNAPCPYCGENALATAKLEDVAIAMACFRCGKTVWQRTATA